MNPKPVLDVLSPNDTANYLLNECRERGEILTNLKLQKLLYYAQAWHLALFDQPLFEEDFQAWIHGPVLPSQYQRFKQYEWRPILETIPTTGFADSKVCAHLTEIVEVFGTETAIALELMTHNERPWQEARQGIPCDSPSAALISKASMSSFYKAL